MSELQSMEINEEQISKFEQWLYDKENAKATIQKYLTDIRTLLRFLGKDKKIDKSRLLEYKEWLRERYAISSVNSMLAALNQFLEFSGVSVWKVRRFKAQKSMFLQEEKELTKGEFHRLVAEARKEGKNWLALCMETIAATGIRISELQYFTVESIRRGRIEVFNKGKYRRILLPAIIQKKLLKFGKENKIKNGSIFLAKNGKPKNRSIIWREMKKLKEKTGIKGEKIFPHNLRHLFARMYYQNTKDLTGLADLLGHSSLNVTRIYTSNTGEIYQRQLDSMQILKI